MNLCPVPRSRLNFAVEHGRQLAPLYEAARSCASASARPHSSSLPANPQTFADLQSQHAPGLHPPTASFPCWQRPFRHSVGLGGDGLGRFLGPLDLVGVKGGTA